MSKELEMIHDQLLGAVESTRNFFNLEGRTAQEVIVEPLIELSDRLQKVDGFMGVFGVGYPFYARDTESGSTLPVPSISDYIQETKVKIQTSADQHGDSWPCAHCQVANKLPNLTDQCVPCDLVSFKPRDLFRVLPDIDAIAIFEEASPEVEQATQEVLTDMGWVRFNTDIKGAFDSTLDVLEGDDARRLPIDFHIITFEQLAEAYQKLLDGPLENQVGTLSRAWRAHWKDQPVDISYSFAFSMTEIGEQAEPLTTLLQHTRQGLLERHNTNRLIDMVARSRRCGPIIGDTALRNALQERLASWGNTPDGVRTQDNGGGHGEKKKDALI